MKNIRKSDQNLVDLIQELKRQAHKNNARIWKDVAQRLEKPSSSWAKINVGKLSPLIENGEVILIPGKLLGMGKFDKKVTIISMKSSKSAVEKVNKSGGKFMDLDEAMSKYPKGSKIRIMG